MPRIPIYDDGAPIACTATGAGLDARARAIERLRDGLASVERTAEGLLLRFPAGAPVEADVRRFTVEEQACCGFFGFAVTRAGHALELRWEGPPDAAPIFDGLQELLAGDGPVTSLSRLL